jgi:hypothetical protein
LEGFIQASNIMLLKSRALLLSEFPEVLWDIYTFQTFPEYCGCD